jgi:hypothetical protein
MEYDETQRGKCITCGCASKCAGTPPQYYEIMKAERSTKLRLWNVMVPAQGVFAFKQAGSQFACIKGVVDFPAIILEFARTVQPNSGQSVSEKTQQLFQEHSGCPEWYPYQPGHTPEWHLSDENMQRIENDRRAFETRLSEISEAIQRDGLRAARLAFWATVIFGIIVVILSIMQVRLASRPTNITIQMPNQQSNTTQAPPP